MNNSLQDNLDEILRQKTTYLVSNNIKSGVTIFNIARNIWQ